MLKNYTWPFDVAVSDYSWLFATILTLVNPVENCVKENGYAPLYTINNNFISLY